MKRNDLNELNGKEWIKFTKTWFINNPKSRSEDEKLHPAKFPEGLIEDFIEFFTKKDERVLDPFAGTGSTLVAAENTGRKGIGIELLKKYSSIAEERIENADDQKIINHDASKIEELDLPEVDFIITSPPYGPMLNKEGLAQEERKEEDLDTSYSDEEKDLGNITDYDSFIEETSQIFKNLKDVLKEDGYLVIILQNYRDGSEYKTLAWDIGNKLRDEYTLEGEKLWLQDDKKLYPYGMGYSFVPNVHHHYCLIFRNR